MNILILGCGYVGMKVGQSLANAGHQVWGLRRSPHEKLGMERIGIHPLIGDLAHPEHWQRSLDTIDAIVNATSSKAGGADGYRSLYLDGTRVILDWALEWPLRSYVHIGSTSVYGQTDGEWVDEDSLTAPANETSRILLETEKLLLAAGRERGTPVTLLRSAGIYGPERGHLFQQFLKGEARITGDGLRWLNMIHRDDLAAAVERCILSPGIGRVLNVCDDEPCTERRFFEWLAEKTGRPLPTPMDPSERVRKRGATNKRISNHKLKHTLGLALTYPSFRQGYEALLT